MFSVAYNPHNLTFKYKWCTAAVETLVNKMHNSCNSKKTEISRWLPNSLQYLKKRQLITDFHANFQQLVKPTNNWIPETKSCVCFVVVFHWTISGQNQHKTEQHSISDKSTMITKSLSNNNFIKITLYSFVLLLEAHTHLLWNSDSKATGMGDSLLFMTTCSYFSVKLGF